MSAEMAEHPRDDLLDLPLPGATAPGDRTPGGRAPGDRFPDETETDVTWQPPRPRRSLGRAFLMVSLVVVGIVIGYFLPRPGPPVLEAIVEVVDFESQRVGAISTERAFGLRNGGRRPLVILGVEISGENAADVSVVSDDCTGAELRRAAECTLLLTFAPQFAGEHTATLSITGEAPNSPLRVPVIGKGIEPGLILEPSRHTFQTLVLGSTGGEETIRARNTGTASLRIERVNLEGRASREFLKKSDGCTGTTIEPGQTCEVRIAFAPQRSGQRQANLRMYSDAPGESVAVDLFGRGVTPQPLVASDPSRLEFPAQLVGSRSETQTLKLRNSGTGGLEIKEIQLRDRDRAFSVDAGKCGTTALSGRSSCELTVRFAPHGEGVFEAQMLVASNSKEDPIPIVLTGIGIEPRLELSIAQIDFGAMGLGETRTSEVQLRNAGSAPLEITRIGLARQVSRNFTVGEDGCSRRTLGPSATCSVTVSFRARDEGRRSGDLIIEHSASTETVHLPLRGQGAVGRLRLSTEKIEFGNVAVGSTERERLTLTNVGSASLFLGEIRIDTIAASDFRIAANGCSSQPELQPAAFCAVVMEHSPATIGRRNAELLIENDGEGGAQRLELTARGVLPDVSPLEARPSSLEFGNQEVNRRSEIQTVTVHNNGTGRIELGTIRLTGADAEQFQIVPGSCAGTPFLASKSECTIGVRLSPDVLGEVAGALSIEHGAAETALAVQLRGLAVVPEADLVPES